MALNQKETIDFVNEHGIAVLRADKTQPAPEVEQFLRTLGNKGGSIPFYAIFPARDPNHPILMDGVFTGPGRIVEALREAVEREG